MVFVNILFFFSHFFVVLFLFLSASLVCVLFLFFYNLQTIHQLFYYSIDWALFLPLLLLYASLYKFVFFYSTHLLVIFSDGHCRPF